LRTRAAKAHQAGAARSGHGPVGEDRATCQRGGIELPTPVPVPQ
jgi:hypothetical protein